MQSKLVKQESIMHMFTTQFASRVPFLLFNPPLHPLATKSRGDINLQVLINSCHLLDAFILQ